MRPLIMAVFVGVAGTGVASAQWQHSETPSSAPLRAMVWLQPGTEEVLDRIRGQTNDLSVELLVDALDPIPGDLDAQLQAAYTFSLQQNVPLVIWFAKQTDAERHFIVNIAIPKTHRLLTRDLGPSVADSGSFGLSSAVKEGAALVVRAAIQAVLSGSTIGELQAARFDELSEPPSSAAAPAPSDTRNSSAWRDTTEEVRPRSPVSAKPLETQPPTDSPGRHDWPWAVGVEWRLPYDGAGDNKIAECAMLYAERRVQSLKAFVAGGGCLNREIDANPYGKFRIARQQAALGANVILLRTGPEASLGVQAGAIIYERSTLPSPGVNIEPPSTHVVGAIGPEFRLLVPAQESRLQAGFVLGLDILTNSLKIGYTDPGVPDRFSQKAQISAVQPYAALGLVFRL